MAGGEKGHRGQHQRVREKAPASGAAGAGGPQGWPGGRGGICGAFVGRLGADGRQQEGPPEQDLVLGGLMVHRSQGQGWPRGSHALDEVRPRWWLRGRGQKEALQTSLRFLLPSRHRQQCVRFLVLLPLPNLSTPIPTRSAAVTPSHPVHSNAGSLAPHPSSLVNSALSWRIIHPRLAGGSLASCCC